MPVVLNISLDLSMTGIINETL